MTKEEKIKEVMELVNHHSDWVSGMSNSQNPQDFERLFDGKKRTEAAIEFKLREIMESAQ